MPDGRNSLDHRMPLATEPETESVKTVEFNLPKAERLNLTDRKTPQKVFSSTKKGKVVDKNTIGHLTSTFDTYQNRSITDRGGITIY